MDNSNNDEKRRKYFEMVDKNIKDHGFHVTYVLEEKDFTPFGYSTGLYITTGIPEVFVSGLPNGLTNTLITNYAKIFKDQEITFYQKSNDLIDRFPVYLIPVDTSALKEKVLSSYRLYDGPKFESIQIIYPDLNGYFPEDKDYDYDMEIFGNIKKL